MLELSPAGALTGERFAPVVPAGARRELLIEDLEGTTTAGGGPRCPNWLRLGLAVADAPGAHVTGLYVAVEGSCWGGVLLARGKRRRPGWG